MALPPKVLIISHLPGRDDIADKMLAREFGKRGAMVWIYPILEHPHDAICTIKPDIVVLPEVRLEYTRDIAKYCHEWGCLVVQRRCEMGITGESEMDGDLERSLFGNLEVEPYIDLDMIWGPKFAEQVEAHGMPREKIKIVGATGFDPYFLPPPVVEPYEKKRVLFAGGFGYADKNAIYAIPEAKPGDSLHHRLVKADRENREQFAELIRAFMQRYPDWEVFVRPHPGEVYSWYSERLPGIKPAIEFPALVAIQLVDLIIHPGSTLAYEANFVNRPTLNFRNTNLDALVGRIAPQCDTVEALLNAVLDVELGKSNADPQVIEALAEYYGPVDGKANERVAEYTLSVWKPKKVTIPGTWPKPKHPQYLIPGVLAPYQAWMCPACGSHFATGLQRDMTKCPYCGIAVSRRYNQLEKLQEIY